MRLPPLIPYVSLPMQVRQRIVIDVLLAKQLDVTPLSTGTLLIKCPTCTATFTTQPESPVLLRHDDDCPLFERFLKASDAWLN